MTYHGGWVMRTNAVYAIYWIPTSSGCGASDPSCSGYWTAINRYFQDVGAASGSNSNVYSLVTQYYDTTGPIAYGSAFAGSYVDRDPFPAYTPGTSCTDSGYAVCLTDQQLRAEIQTAITARTWPNGKASMFFIMLPDKVAVCATSASDACAPPNFCGFHNGFSGSNGQPLIYAVIPYDETDGCHGNPPNPSPNGDDADAAINVISHEQIEAITDPGGDGWYAGDHEHEIADLCAWNFGNPLGTAPNGQSYNEVINGHYYWLQQEWSNDSSICLQRYVPGALPPTSVGPPVVTGTAAVGKVLSTSNGTWAAHPSSYSYQWQRCTTAGSIVCTTIPGATAATYQLAAADAGLVLRSEVTAQNPAGVSSPVASAATPVVVPVLVATALPTVSGVAAVDKTLSLTNGTWNSTVDSSAYQWLRCAANNSGCTPITGATNATYLIGARDAGSTLEARVDATNAAGTVSALSSPTSIVIAKPVATHAPSIKGKAKAGRRLQASPGIWSGAPTALRYQWLRCNKRGTQCRTISQATHPTYTPHSADVGHKLRVRVTATTIAGSATATSPASPLVTR